MFHTGAVALLPLVGLHDHPQNGERLVFVKVHFTVSPGSSLNVAILVVRFPLVVDAGDHLRGPTMPATPVSKKVAPATSAGAFPPFILQVVTYFLFRYGFLARSSPCTEMGDPVNVKV